MYKVVVVCIKGGVGKTLTVLSLAAEFGILSKGRLKGLLVDCDPTCNSSNPTIGAKDTDATIYDVYKNPDLDIREAIYPADQDQYPGLYVLAGDSRMSEVDELLARRAIKETVLHRALKAVEHEFDYAIIDTPASKTTMLKNAVCASDAYIVPIEHDIQAIDGYLFVQNLIDELSDVWVELRPKPKNLGVFFTKVEPKGNAIQRIEEMAKKEVKEKLLPIKIPKSIHAKEARIDGLSLQHDRVHPISVAYSALAQYLLKTFESNDRGGEKWKKLQRETGLQQKERKKEKQMRL